MDGTKDNFQIPKLISKNIPYWKYLWIQLFSDSYSRFCHKPKTSIKIIIT